MEDYYDRRWKITMIVEEYHGRIMEDIMKINIALISGIVLLMGCTSFTPKADTEDSVQNQDIPGKEDGIVNKDGGTDTIFTCATNDDCKDVDIATGPCQEVVCQEGRCVSGNAETGTACSPQVPDGLDTGCISGTCDKNGKCLMKIKDGTVCDDEDLCTDNDECKNGVCKGNARSCTDDGNACTKEYCDPDTGKCVSDDLGKETPCDDGNSCTTDDYCDDGECVSGKNNCACTKDDDCKQYDDTNLCNGVLKCADDGDGHKACQVDPSSVIKCDTGSDDQCHQTKCVPDTGKCESAVLAGDACDDGDKCTYKDKCLSNGSCEGEAIKCVDDGNECTKSACDTSSGECKTEKLDGTPCTMDDKCLINTKCVDGACKGDQNPCEDNNDCTTDSCDPVKGCVHKVLLGDTCDDKNACTKDTTCQANGTCAGGTSICECTTDDDCHDDVLCDGKMKCKIQADNTKKCVNDMAGSVSCDTSKDDDCNETICVPGVGCKTKILVNTPCDDHDVCSANTKCNATGTCAGGIVVPNCCHSDADCDDGNTCTLDACDMKTGKCKNSKRGMNFNSCGTSKFCWNGNCLTQNTGSVSLPLLFGGTTTNSLFNSISVHGNRLFATAVRRDENTKCSNHNGIFTCLSAGTWTDKGWVYEIKGMNAALVGSSLLTGQTGNMAKDGDDNYIFPSSPAVIPPITDVAYNMAVGWNGAVGLLVLSDPPKLNWANAAKTAISSFAPGNLSSVWHGLIRSGSLFCSSRTHNYLIGGTKSNSKFISLCKDTHSCFQNTGDKKCICQPEVWACGPIKWTDLTSNSVNAVTGYSTTKDYSSSFLDGDSSISGMTLASGYTKLNPLSAFVAIGQVSGTSASTQGSAKTGLINDRIQDIVAVTSATGLMVTSKELFWYDKNQKTPIIDVTPQTTGDCNFYKAFEYDRQVMIVAVCQIKSGVPPMQLCTTSTFVYYADCANGQPDTIKKVTVDSQLSCSSNTRVGRAVAAGSDFITVVGGGTADHKSSIITYLK